jgi:hypothetical protein
VKDPIPPGFIYFPEVWEKFHAAKWKGASPLDKGESSDEEIEIWRIAAEEELAAPFRRRELVTCVRFSRQKKKIELPPGVCKYLPLGVFRTGHIFNIKSKDCTPFTEEAPVEVWLRLCLKQYRSIEQLAFDLAETYGLTPAEVSAAIFRGAVRGELDGSMLHKSGYPDFRSRDLYEGFNSYGAKFNKTFEPMPLIQFINLPDSYFCEKYGEIFLRIYIDQLAVEVGAASKLIERSIGSSRHPSPVADAVVQGFHKAFPNDVPKGMGNTDRNKKIREAINELGLSLPNSMSGDGAMNQHIYRLRKAGRL